ncbi:MAG TPA: MmgE/PrpD family protein [Steroidobacteraceae bacterium]|nr:MmgE/PrpD family protein [Steroidobacteraceae bacterium]
MSLDLDISARLAQHLATIRYEDLSPATIHSANRALLDGLGVMLAASGLSEDIQPFVAMARSMSGAGESSILGSWERVSANAAAFANGAMAHALDFEDSFDAAPTHPNASLIPAALATAQSLQGVTVGDFLLAMAVGCDITCRVALSVGDALERRPWDPPPNLGAFGAVAATAKLLNLNPEQINDAFSLMLCQTACPGEIKHSEHSVIRAVREAFPAQAAVTSALLAAKGVRGFDRPLEGRGGFYRLFANGECNDEALFADLGKRFYIDELSFKPWPCCRGTHPYIEAAQQLRSQHGIEWRDIKSIRARIGPVQRMLSEPLERKRAPSTVIDAKFSIPFTIATAFVEPEVTLDCFSIDRLRKPDVLSLSQIIEFDYQEQNTSATSGAIKVELNGGSRFEAEIPQALGHPTRPLDDSRLVAKFVDCAMRAAKPMSRDDAEALAERLMGADAADGLGKLLQFS